MRGWLCLCMRMRDARCLQAISCIKHFSIASSSLSAGAIIVPIERQVVRTVCHAHRASHHLSYDEFVRKTIKNESVPPRTTCASIGMENHSLMSGWMTWT